MFSSDVRLDDNFSVNKNNEEFEHNESPEECTGHKWSLRTFWKYLESQGVDWQRVWRRIKNTCVKTVMCGHQDILQGIINIMVPITKLLFFQFSRKNHKVITTVTNCLESTSFLTTP